MDYLQVVLVLILIFVSFGAVLSGIPVAFALGGAAINVALIATVFGVFDLTYLGAIPSRIFGTAMFNEVLTAVPLFVLMGIILERSNIAEDLLTNMSKVFGRLPAGLGISVTFVGALLAASTGIVGATVVTMGLLSLPTMLKRGYSPSFAAGTICSSGTLGQIIPPSIVLVFLGDQLSGAYMEAQREIGNFSPEPVSVGDLFAGALIPGLGLAFLYMLYQLIVGMVNPKVCPPMTKEELGDIVWADVFMSLFAPIGLIVLVLGCILAGIATPTEAAGVGATGALLLTGRRLCSDGDGQRKAYPLYQKIISIGIACTLLLPIVRSFADLRLAVDVITPWNGFMIGVAMLCSLALLGAVVASLAVFKNRKLLSEIATMTMRVSTLAFIIVVGATIFSLVLRSVGGDEVVEHMLSQIPGGVLGALIVISIVVFLLGFILDFIEIVFIIMPIVAPIIL